MTASTLKDLQHAIDTVGSECTVDALRMTCAQVDSNPSMDDSAGMDHWRCTLTYKGRRMSVIFSMGRGHDGREPEAKEVLNSLLMDATCAGESFEDFCGNCGYDTDSRKAERIYKACQSINVRVDKLLGNNREAVRLMVEDC